jgi:hypothetical protein
MRHVGVVVADRGAAIVEVERGPDDALLVTGIVRLPFALAAVTDHVRGLDPAARVVIDAEGLGSALWGVLGRPDDAEHWQLYAGRGLERQALVDELLVAVQEGRFHFAPALAEQDAMSKALQGYRRQVREDGVIGGELVVALLLALIPPPPVLEVFVAWGDNPFLPGDGADGARLRVLRRDPDGKPTQWGEAHVVSGPADDD